MWTVSYNRNYYSKYPQRDNWLSAAFGAGSWGINIKPGIVWSQSECFGHWIYYFTNKEDADMFAIRWPGGKTKEEINEH